jgi:hypothetical protein
MTLEEFVKVALPVFVIFDIIYRQNDIISPIYKILTLQLLVKLKQWTNKYIKLI